jgi:hypothetical protein
MRFPVDDDDVCRRRHLRPTKMPMRLVLFPADEMFSGFVWN